MRIYKFGGASVKDASGVKNLVKILNELGSDKTLIVVSAMGKMTNSLEFVVKNYFENQKELDYSLNEIFIFHNNILSLFIYSFSRKPRPFTDSCISWTIWSYY